MSDEMAADLIDELAVLKNDRKIVEQVWDELAANVVPHRRGFSEQPIRGEHKVGDIYDGTPIAALNMFASGTMGYLLSAHFDWFGLRVPDEQLMDNREVRQWLAKCDAILTGMIARSNFYKEMLGFFLDWGGVGTATIYRYWDTVNRRECFTVRHPREIYIAESEHSEVDTVFREFLMTSKQMLASFKDDTLDSKIRDEAGKPGQRYNEHLVVHAMKPNDNWNPKSKESTRKRYSSVYLDEENGRVMREGGYDHMPYAVGRPDKQSDEVYGRGPAWNALSDIKGLYEYARTDIDAAQMLVNPPIQYPEEMRGKLKWVPGGRMEYEDAGRLVKEPEQRIQMRAGLDREERKQKIIERHFLVDFFSMIAQAEKEMTTVEVRQRREEKAVLLGPHITGFNQDVLDVLIDGLFWDAWDEGMIPPPPRVLLESTDAGKIEVDYMGPLAQAQRSFFRAEPYRNSLGEWNALTTILVNSGRQPDFLDNYDLDYISREMAKAGGMPEEAMLDEKKVAAMRKARQQAAQRAQQLAAMEQMGKAVPGLNQPVEAGSVLEGMGKAREAAGTPA